MLRKRTPLGLDYLCATLEHGVVVPAVGIYSAAETDGTPVNTVVVVAAAG